MDEYENDEYKRRVETYLSRIANNTGDGGCTGCVAIFWATVFAIVVLIKLEQITSLLEKLVQQ